MNACRNTSAILVSVLTLVCGCSSNSSNGSPQNTPQVTSNVFNGQYAFVLSGFDPAGNPMGIIGSIVADGLGHITGGSIEVNDDFAVSLNNGALTGTYTLDSNVRGVITLTSPVGSVAQPLAFAFTLRADGTSGDLIGFDNNNFIAAGTIQQQDKTAFSLAALSASSGSFAFEFDSAAAARTSTVGRFTLGANGISSGGLFDVSVAGTGPTTVGGSLSVTFAASGPDGNGRGSLSASENGAIANYVYFIINAGRFAVMQTDTNFPNTLNVGVAEKQILPLSTTTVNTPGCVFALTGFDSGLNNAISTVGQLQATASSMATLLWDSDDGGTIFNQKNVVGEPLTFDAMSGRGTITVGGGSGNGLFDRAVFYLTDSGKGFLLDASAAQANRALSGRVQSQIGVGNFSATNVAGKMIVRLIGRIRSSSINEQDALDGLVSKTLSNNTFQVATVGDIRRQFGPSSLNATNSDTETFTIDANTGRGTIIFAGNTNVFYLIGQSQYVLIDETPPPPNTLPIAFFDPQ